MNKQSKKIYVSLMNRIAIALMVNQGVLMLLGSILGMLETTCLSVFGKNVWVDAVFRLGECVAYFAGFIIPVILFNLMNKNVEKEIYEPVDSDEKASPLMTVFALGIGLGATTLTAYANYYIVNAFWDYSDFTQQYFWNVELDHTYQIVIYFIYVAIIPALVEELLFRGTICKVLSVYGKGTAVVVSAVLFSLMHTNIEQALYTLVAGLLLGWIYVETKNILYPILLHFVNNGISAVGDILYEKASTVVYNAYISYSEMIIWVFMAISLVGFLLHILKKGRFIGKLVLKPDENGEQVAPLSIGERVSGFLSIGMIIFVVYCMATMVLYIYLSTQML